MSYDNICKLLAERYPDRFAAWLLGESPTSVSVLKTELSIEPIRADSLIFLALSNRILHLEFQTRLASEPPLPLRMLDYWVRLYRRYRCPITQILVLLTAPADDHEIVTTFQEESTFHQFQVIALWQQDPTLFLQDPALLPLAPLTATTEPQQLLGQTAARISAIKSEAERRDVSACAQILAGLRFQPNLIRQLFQESTMRESAIYQEIWQEGCQEGRQEGRQEGWLDGERSLIYRLLNRRVGLIAGPLQTRINQLPQAQLEALGEALLDFTSSDDLVDWLNQVDPSQEG